MTVRACAFDGDEVKYRLWEGKALALAGSKGFLLALTKESTGTALTVEEYEYGEVEVPGIAVTGGAVGAAKMCPTTTAENCKYLAKAAAWIYLVASCTDKAYALGPYFGRSTCTVPLMPKKIIPNLLGQIRIQNFGSMTWIT